MPAVECAPGVPLLPQTQGPCSTLGPGGGTLQARTSIGLVNLVFNGQQYLTGIGVPLTGSEGVTAGGFYVPPNTLFGAQLLAGGGVSLGFNNPVQFPGFISGEITTATFSGGRFTEVNGAVTVGGITPFSAFTPSSTILNGLNANSSALQVASDIQSFLQFASKNVKCESLFGGAQ